MTSVVMLSSRRKRCPPRTLESGVPSPLMRSLPLEALETRGYRPFAIRDSDAITDELILLRLPLLLILLPLKRSTASKAEVSKAGAEVIRGSLRARTIQDFDAVSGVSTRAAEYAAAVV